MRLDFNVLWVEDQPNNVLSSREAIDRKIRAEGFRLQTKFAGTVDEAKDCLGSDVYGDHIDLILMDYDLGFGKKGDEGLDEVRRAFPYKDIVFYSAQAGNISALVANKQIQGVFCSDRLGLADTVEGVFESLVKKVLDIDHSRGIIMGSSSDIDGLVLDCLTAHFAGDEGRLSEPARKIISDRLVEIRERFEDGAAGVAAATNVSELADLHAVYTSIDRLNLLRKVLASNGGHNDACKAMKSYAQDTVPKRNTLAHVRVQQDGFSRRLYDRKGKELTSEEVRTLRLSLLGHQERLERLAGELKER